MFAGVAVSVAVAMGSLGCSSLGGNPAVAGDDPSINQATIARRKNLPYCPGGDRAKACLLRENCRVTEQGCQVCQCQTLAE